MTWNTTGTGRRRRLALLLAACLLPGARAADPLHGIVLDANGNPLAQAMVTLNRAPGAAGAAAVTVFTGSDGRFVFPAAAGMDTAPAVVSVKKLGYAQVEIPAEERGTEPGTMALIMSSSTNQAGTAPASAWMAGIARPEDKAKLVMNCVGCHQYPAPEVRHYADMIHDVASTDPEQVRLLSWRALVKYMNFLSAEEFGRGAVGAAPVDANSVYSVRDDDVVPGLLAGHMTGAMDTLSGYDYGAPLAVNPDTLIREYAIDQPNTVREALLLGSPPMLWGADVLSNNIVRVDPASGAQRIFTVPVDIPMGPHTLLREGDHVLWATSFFNGIVARLDTAAESWQVWKLRTPAGTPIGMHDLSFDYHHVLTTDRRGWIWYSDILDNAVGYFDPATDATGVYRVPEIPGRPGRNASLYGLVMSSDRKYIWYSQVGIGSFGCFNTETLEFETSVSLPMIDAGPRRITMNDDDTLYVALYGSGQLLEYDTRNRRTIGTYDLPDRASAPYAVTWDNVRRVVWIPTSNGNVIYRFDPRDKSFAAIPLPREGAFLRMVGVDPDTGVLVSAYGNIAETVHGPRMIVVVDPGDDYQALKQQHVALHAPGGN